MEEEAVEEAAIGRQEEEVVEEDGRQEVEEVDGRQEGAEVEAMLRLLKLSLLVVEVVDMEEEAAEVAVGHQGEVEEEVDGNHPEDGLKYV